MGNQFNPTRLKLARIRKKMTFKALAEAIGMSAKMVSMHEKEDCLHEPHEQTIIAFAKALNYPESFFFGEDIEELDPTIISFRSLKKMKASQEYAAIGAGQLALIINSYFESNFNLPKVALPDLRNFQPETAAEAIRDYWGLGTKSIRNVVHLLEMKGVRVYSLAENTIDVDAFSFWKDNTPFILLNTQKSGERSRFDAAHELGHLLLHRHGSPQGNDLEREADQFASAFLMPKSSILASKPAFPSLDSIIQLKKNWLVSTMALIVRMKNVGAITEWQYRNLMVEASRKGLKTYEINGIKREKSLVIEKVLSTLAAQNITLPIIGKRLNLPLDEISNLLFKFGVISGGTPNIGKDKVVPKLTLVEKGV